MPMGSVTCGTGIKGIRAWSISPKKPAYLNSTSDARNTMPDKIPSTAPDAITRNLHTR